MVDEKVVSLLERAFLFLEDGEWQKADEYCERVLDIDPRNAKAYLGKLLAELKIKNQEELALCVDSFENNPNFQKIERFGDEELVSKLKADVVTIKKRNEAKEKAEKEARDKKLSSVKKILTVAIPLALGIVIILVAIFSISDAIKYNNAMDLFESGKYDEAISAFQELEDYKDSQELIKKSQQKLKEAEEKSKKEKAEKEKLEKEKAKKERLQKVYDEAEEYLANGNKARAAISFGLILDYSDARKRCFELWDEIADRSTIAAGWDNTLAVKNNGDVVAAGADAKYFSDWEDVVAVSSSFGLSGGTLALKSDGTVFGEDDTKFEVESWKDIVAISAGSDHAVGLKTNGSVVSTRYHGYGLSDFDMYNRCDVSLWYDIISVKAGGNFTVGLRSDGTIILTESKYNDYLHPAKKWKDIVAISAGEDHIVGLKADGTVVAAGYNYNGQCNVSGWKDIVAISAGSYHTVAIRSDGTVITTNYKNHPDGSPHEYHGQCGIGGVKDAVAVSAGSFHSVALKADGTVVASGYKGDEYKGQCDVQGWTNIMKPRRNDNR